MKKLSNKTIASYRQSLGALIKARREAKGMSQTILAEALKTEQPRIAEIERGDIKSIDKFLECVHVLGGQIQFVWK